MYGYIYLTTNLIDGKIYIGQHKSSIFSTTYKGSGTLIREAFKKYGKENFKVELLEECENQEEMDDKERYYEKIYGLPNFTIGYNISHGGQDKMFTGLHHSENTKLLMSEKKKGIVFSEERCHKISENKKGIKQSEEASFKRSKTLKEKYAREGRVSPHKGHPLSEESKLRMSLAHKGKEVSEATRLKMSQSHLGSKHKPHKPHNYPKNRKSKLDKNNNASNSGEAH